jgi:vancomycin resistance protein VanW
MANLLYWLILHTPLKIKEHHHHMLDIFPDSGRTLPFGSGAGVLYNYGDLQFENKTNSTFYLKTYLDKEFLYGEIFLVGKEFDLTYKIIERDHLFYFNEDEKLFRKNKIFRIIKKRIGGKFVKEELITVNNSKVLYQMTEQKILELNNFYAKKQLESDRVASQMN